MITLHVKTAFRYLLRQRGYALLNVAGLAIGLAVCGVLLLFVHHETRYDAFHENADRIHLLAHEQVNERGEREATHLIPHEVGQMIDETVPTVEQVARIMDVFELRVVQGGEVSYLTDLYYADPEVFGVFTFPFLAGDPETALREPYSIVIDSRLAGNLFGPNTPDEMIGRTITNHFEWDGEAYSIDYTVTGIMANVPATAHWQPRGLMSMSTLRDAGSYRVTTYALFRDLVNTEGILQLDPSEIAAMQRIGLGSGGFLTQPIRDIHLYGKASNPDVAATLPISRIRIFAGIGLLILLLAVINYVNLSTALGLMRSRMVGIQKALGARRSQVAAQTLLETVLLALIAAFIALLLIVAALPYFRDTVQVALSLSLSDALWMVLVFLLFAVVTGLLAGAYPAVVLSATRPAVAFQGGLSGVTGARMRRVIVLFQISAFIALIVATQVMNRQLGFMQDYDIGLQPDQVLVIDGRHTQDRMVALKDRLERESSILEVALSADVPGHSSVGTSTLPRPGADESEPHLVLQWYRTSSSFLDVVGAQLVAGARVVTDITDPDQTFEVGMYLNETAASLFGWTPEEAIEQDLYGRPIAGVIRDFHHQSLHVPVQPMMVSLWPTSDATMPYVLLRFRAGDAQAAIEAASVAWSETASGDPFNAYFLDEHFAALYDSEQRLAELFGVFSTLAALVAALGLFGLAAFTAQRRRREIGIRKVIGASAGSVVWLLTRDFLKLVGVAFLIAAPVAYWIMRDWLDNFAYRISLEPGIFLITVMMAVIVTLLAVGYHALRAATADPVKAIRSE